MVILIGGTSHTGKTLLAQKLLEMHHFPYLSIDHLKMGLIRSGQTALTPMDDDKLTLLLWPIVREMIKTAIENRQNLIVEGCYIPGNWYEDFSEEYLSEIRCRFLIMTEAYIRKNLGKIRSHANAIEQRLDETLDPEDLIRDNREVYNTCRQEERILLTDGYPANLAHVFFGRNGETDIFQRKG